MYDAEVYPDQWHMIKNLRSCKCHYFISEMYFRGDIEELLVVQRRGVVFEFLDHVVGVEALYSLREALLTIAAVEVLDVGIVLLIYEEAGEIEVPITIVVFVCALICALEYGGDTGSKAPCIINIQQGNGPVRIMR